MLLAPEVLVGLKRLCNKSIVGDDDFKTLLNKSVAVLSADESRKEEPLITELRSSRVDTLKEAFAALLTVLTESTKNNLSDTSLLSILESYNLDPDRSQELVQVHYQYNKIIQNNLKLFSHHLPHIIDVKWRLDYSVKSSGSSGSGCLLYFVQFICQSADGSKSSVNFVCSVEQLKEFVDKLQDACRKIEKISNLTKN